MSGSWIHPCPENQLDVRVNAVSQLDLNQWPPVGADSDRLASGPTRRQDGAMRPRVIVSDVASMDGKLTLAPGVDLMADDERLSAYDLTCRSGYGLMCRSVPAR